MLMASYATAERTAIQGSLKKGPSNLILANLNKRFEQVEVLNVFTRATLLDPRFKNQCCRPESKKKAAIAGSELEVKRLHEQ